ncbi:MAG: hypothetical protein FWG99_08820 [Treponema sp.]|nr:hypothetical protein [Treponema sp.]
MVFTIGNLITIGIVALTLILYRFLDKNNRSLDKVRKFADKCKDDIAAYVEEKSIAVKNFGIDLDVERKAAAELMKSIQKITEEELAKKAQTIAYIDEQIKAYDSSLQELAGMTGRVQENLHRIRDESAFVESAGKKVGEAREKMEQIQKALSITDKNLHEAEDRYRKQNAEALEMNAKALISATETRIAGFETVAKTIERKVAEHRLAVDRVEKEREAVLARDTEQINKTLREAVEKAGSRANKLEETALVKLREQAQERINQLKTLVEEKIKAVQENAKGKLGEINTALTQTQSEWKQGFREFNTEAKKQQEELNDSLNKQTENWKELCKNSEQNIISAVEKRLGEYKSAHTESINQLNNLADDAARLDSELRSYMQGAMNRVSGDFADFEKESRTARDAAIADFKAQSGSLRKELKELDKELDEIKQQAFDNVSGKLKKFEESVYGEIEKRSAEIENKMTEAQQNTENLLKEAESANNAEWRKIEENVAAEQRKNIADIAERLTTDLNRLKQEASAFEDGIREEMRNADDSRLSFADQNRRDLEEIRLAAENEVKNQIGQHHLTMQETLRQKQRELDEKLEEISDNSETRYAAIETSAENSRKTIEEWHGQLKTQMRDMDASMEELRRRSRDMATENDERIDSMRVSLEDIRKELGVQTKVFAKTGELKQELERRMEEISGDLDRLDQRKNEIVQIESQFTRIKRLEDEVNAKMTRFLSEKHRIELMESDFNRLLQTSQAVEEKLTQVSTSDDILQGVQVQIRRLEDSIKETEEKYQRVQRKSQTLEETTESIDRNFKSLQETEAALKTAGETISLLTEQSEYMRSSIESLVTENEKARDTSDKLAILDDSLTLIEKRIVEMNVAREWLARLETEMQALDKDAQTQLRLTKSLLSREGGKITAAAAKSSKGAPPPQDRDNVIRLKRSGWTIDEIANALGLSKGEVELILELGSLD